MAKTLKVQTKDDGSLSIDLGWAIKLVLGLVITSIVGSVASIPFLSIDVSAQETRLKIVEAAQSRVERNQALMDETMRNLKADSDWAQLKLDRLLTALQVTERIDRPDVLESKLEKPK